MDSRTIVRDQTLAGLPALSVVVPCYDEEDGLDELYRRTSAAARATVGESYEIVLVDDGSRDRRTAAMMRRLARADPTFAASS